MRRWLRFSVTVGVAGLVVGFLAARAASAQQSVNFYMGGFVPTSADARGDISGGLSNDVLVRNQEFLSFHIKDFDGVTFGGEWLVPLHDNFEAGLGLGFFQESVHAVDSNYVNANGSEVVTDLKLRIVPFTATVRLLPLGHDAPVQPYVGAGVGVFGWRYSENGQFVDPSIAPSSTGASSEPGGPPDRSCSAACACRWDRRRRASRRAGRRRTGIFRPARDSPARKSISAG